MKVNSQKILLSVSLLFSILLGGYLLFESYQYDELTNEECTIGVVSANSTTDGRPLLWKIRDNSEYPNNEVVYDTTCLYSFIAVMNNGDTSVWMGVNENGLSIVNSTSKDLPTGSSGYSNGTMMRAALGYCKTVQEFEELLIATNVEGRRTRANFALIDSTGAAVIFETGGKEFWKFDADNPLQAPNGYLIRTNFSMTGGGREGIQRYIRTKSLIGQLQQNNRLNYKGIIKNHLRDFSDEQSNPVGIPFMDTWADNKPFGYINSNYSVSRSKSISASVINGVLQSETANYTTMWTTIGQPASSIPLPFWCVGETPELVRGETISPLYEAANKIKSFLFDDIDRYYLDTYKLKDDLGNGILKNFSDEEDFIINTVEQVFNTSTPDNNLLLLLENEFAVSVYSLLQNTEDKLSHLLKLIVQNNEAFDIFEDVTFEDGDVIQLIDAGSNRIIDKPVSDQSDPEYGMPGGDDKLVGRLHLLGENSDKPFMFYFPVLLWLDNAELPYAGANIYLRIFDNHELLNSEWYGESQLYEIQINSNQDFIPELIRIKALGPNEYSDYSTTNSIEPGEFRLYQNYPNPFNPGTVIKFTIYDPPAGRQGLPLTILKVYDVLGNEITTLVNNKLPAGEYEVEFNAGAYNLTSGIYFARLEAGSFIQTRKMTLIK